MKEPEKIASSENTDREARNREHQELVWASATRQRDTLTAILGIGCLMAAAYFVYIEFLVKR
jgi:hypothetical protein